MEEDFPPNQKQDNTDEAKKCYLYAIKLLAKRDYSKFKISQKMRDKGYSQQVIDKTTRKLIQLNYLREDLYREARIKGLIHKGYHPSAIIYRMAQENCETNQEEVLSVYKELKLAPELQLQEIIKKKVRIEQSFVSDPQKLKSRVIRYAASKGHPLSQINSLVQNIL